MNEMENNRSEYVGGGYRDYRGNYRYGNRESYRDDYRDEYGRNYRGGRMRNYRSDDIYEEIGNAMFDAKTCHRKMEDLADETDDPQIKNVLMKIAMREKEHYQSLKELMEK